MAGNENWRKTADTHKSGVDSSNKSTPGNSSAGGILHQRRSLPYSPWKMALGGVAILGGIYYVTLYTKKKPEADATDVLKVATNTARPEDTRPRK